jgi:hypothetical protein
VIKKVVEGRKGKNRQKEEGMLSGRGKEKGEKDERGIREIAAQGVIRSVLREIAVLLVLS